MDDHLSDRVGTSADVTDSPDFSKALRFWIRLGFISFGGPAGQIAIMHRELVEKNRWISEAHFLHALNFCMLLPGPEASSSRPTSDGGSTEPGEGSRPDSGLSCPRSFSFSA